MQRKISIEQRKSFYGSIKCDICSKIFQSTESTCQKCKRNACNTCAPNKIIIPSVDMTTQSKICQPCFKEMIQTQSFCQENELKFGTLSSIGQNWISSIKDKDLLKQFEKHYQIISQRKQKEELESYNSYICEELMKSNFSLKEFQYFCQQRYSISLEILINLIDLICINLEKPFDIDLVQICNFFLYFCDEKTSFILISILLQQKQENIVQIVQNHYSQHYDKSVHAYNFIQKNTSTIIGKYFVNYLSFNNQINYFKRIFQNQDISIPLICGLINRSLPLENWQSSFTCESNIIQEIDAQCTKQFVPTIDLQILKKKEAQFDWEKSDNIYKNHSCFDMQFLQNDDKNDQIIELNRIIQDLEKQIKELKEQEVHNNLNHKKQINDYNRIIEVALDQQYKIMNLGSQKSYTIASEFISFVEKMIEQNIELGRKTQQFKEFYLKQETLIDPFKEDMSLVFNELQQRYNQTLAEYKQEIKNLHQIIQSLQDELKQMKQQSKENELTLQEFDSFENEIKELRGQNQILKKLFFQSQEQDKNEYIENDEFSLKFQNVSSQILPQNSFQDSFADTLNIPIKEISQNSIQTVKKRPNLRQDTQRTGHVQLCSDEKCRVF